MFRFLSTMLVGVALLGSSAYAQPVAAEMHGSDLRASSQVARAFLAQAYIIVGPAQVHDRDHVSYKTSIATMKCDVDLAASQASSSQSLQTPRRWLVDNLKCTQPSPKLRG